MELWEGVGVGGAYRVRVGKSERKRPLGRPRRRCRILKWILKKCDWGEGGMDCSGSG